MIGKFLTAKHWQLFVLIVVLPFCFQGYIFRSVMLQFLGGDVLGNPDEIIANLRFMPLVMLVFMAFHFFWFWSVSIGLQSKIPAELHMKVKKFKILFAIPVIYIALISLFMSFAADGFADPESDLSDFFPVSLLFIVIPLHFVSIFGILYGFYFTAKTVKTVELQREVKFSDFIGEFFLIWFFPIGVWILQPKVNALVKDGGVASEQVN